MRVLMDDYGRVVPCTRLLATASLRHCSRAASTHIARLRLRLRKTHRRTAARGRARAWLSPGAGHAARDTWLSPALAWSPALPLRPLERHDLEPGSRL
jgi:hypothetical protein